jgi:hypothetical protein
MNFCKICNSTKSGYINKLEEDDIVFICYGCGTLMTNSEENLKYYTNLIDILEVPEENEIKKAEVLENHFNNSYTSSKIKKDVENLMIKHGKWINVEKGVKIKKPKKLKEPKKTKVIKNVFGFLLDSDSDN